MKREEYKTGDLVNFTLNGKVTKDFVCKVEGVNHMYFKGKFYAPANWEKYVEQVGHDASLEIHEYHHVPNVGFRLIKK